MPASQKPVQLQLLQAKFSQALALHQRGQIAEAQLLCERILKVEPRHFDSLHLLGVSLHQMRQLEPSLHVLSTAVKLNPTHAPVHYNHANVLKALKRLPEAIASYETAIRLKPDYVQAYANCGNALRELGRCNEALSFYDRAIELKPDQAEIHNNRGNALLQAGRLDDAIAAYDKAIALKRDYAEALSNRGNVLLESGQLREAGRSFNAAIAIKPGHAPAYSGRGVTRIEWEDRDGAVSDFEAALAHDPSHLPAISGYSRLPASHLPNRRAAELLAALDGRSDGNDLVDIGFTRARLLARIGELNRSFKCICEANSRRRAEIGVDDNTWRSRFDKLEAELPSWRPRNPTPGSATGRKLLVILGPSRSGKTSLERLVCRNRTFYRGFEACDAESVALELDRMVEHGMALRGKDVLKVLFPDAGDVLSNDRYSVLTITNPYLLSAACRIYDLLHGSFFVFLKRDPIDNAAEIFATDYPRKPIFACVPEMAQAYVNRYNRLSESLADLMTGRARIVDYETLGKDPTSIIASVHDLLGLDPSEHEALCDEQGDRRLKSPYNVYFSQLIQGQVSFYRGQHMADAARL